MAAEITYKGKGWRRDGSAWIGLFRGARPLRLPPGVRWEEVSARQTRDTQTGEVIERHDAATAPFAPEAAGRKLDRVRDIETVVELLAPAVAAPPRKSWADMCSDKGSIVIAIILCFSSFMLCFSFRVRWRWSLFSKCAVALVSLISK